MRPVGLGAVRGCHVDPGGTVDREADAGRAVAAQPGQHLGLGRAERAEQPDHQAAVGPPPDLGRLGAEEFWSTLEDYYLRFMAALAGSPQLAALLRGWVAASRTPALQQALGEVEQATLPWIEQALLSGQRVGAVRDDAPPALLVAVVLGMGEAMDMWLVSQPPDEEAMPALVRVLMGMIRGAIGA